MPRPRPCEAENATLFGGTQPRVHTARDCPKLLWKYGASFIQQLTLPSQVLFTVFRPYSAQEVVLTHPAGSGPLGPAYLLGSQVPQLHNFHR